MSNKRSPIFLGFASQKGGVGKSTLAEVVSSLLFYEEGFNLFVVDCDVSQDSFFKLREREKQAIEENPELSQHVMAHFAKLGRKAYRILKASPAEAISTAQQYIERSKGEAFDLVVFDFPGHAGTADLLELSLAMDYILSPIEADIQSLVSCMSYARSVQDLGVSMQDARIKEVMMLWNKVDRRVRSTLIEMYSAYIVQEGLTLIDQHVYAMHRFSHELALYGTRGVFRSTYLPPYKALRAGTGIEELVTGLITRLHLKTPKHDGND